MKKLAVILHLWTDYTYIACVYEILTAWWIYRYDQWPSIQLHRNYCL